MSLPLFDLSGKTALVTAASKGLGRAMALGFAQAGAQVMIASRNAENLQAAAAAIQQASGQPVRYAVADMLRREDIRRLAEEALASLGKVDILVNNAGINRPQLIDEIRDQDWDEQLQLNLSAAMDLTRRLVPGMKERRWGRVIHISSMMGLGSAAGRSAYSATKAALIGLAQAGAVELGPFNITVNCIAPGPFATELPVAVLSKEQWDILADRTALGRWGRPEELAGPALLLASDAGSYITGSVLLVDGGTIGRVF